MAKINKRRARYSIVILNEDWGLRGLLLSILQYYLKLFVLSWIYIASNIKINNKNKLDNIKWENNRKIVIFQYEKHKRKEFAKILSVFIWKLSLCILFSFFLSLIQVIHWVGPENVLGTENAVGNKVDTPPTLMKLIYNREGRLNR
jgi:hypothetical protein